ncbi:hypothetical protein Sjap_021620 [Stephania japonica]|uniref:Uncharacterized protein n=1 Tax=Stephania japonica TaxID=461633 RepID=A0AAP0ESZ7_9MAGN
MARTKKTEDGRKAEARKIEEVARKTEKVNKKTVEKGERVGMRVQIASYMKSKELGGDSELHDKASATQDLDGRELTIRSSQVSSAEASSPKSSEEDRE